jgi:Ca2+-binding EF-hand superfamily protein
MIQPSAFRRSPADLPGSCRRTRCPTASYTTLGDTIFTLADRNRDGYLDPSEFPIIRRAGTAFADADFGYFDENQDGKITRSEFVDKPSEFILQFDKNGDCRVTQDEMKGASTDQKPPNGRGKKF